MQVELSKDLARHLRRGHPWVFRKALIHPPKAPAGEVVDVVSGGRFIARGLFDPHSPIAVRLLTHDDAERVGPALWQKRIQRAARLRRELLDLKPDGPTNAYRLVHGENDFLPGVVVDIYAGFAVLKLYSAAWTPHRADIVGAVLEAVPGLKGVFGRDEIGREDADGDNGGGSRLGRLTGGGRRPEHRIGKALWGEEPPAKVQIREEGVSLWVDVRGGQKTGLFLDQRENRAALRRYSAGRDVLNCFCYTGGFSVHAALAQAKQVTSVDLDADALQLARENFALNGLDPGDYEFRVGDVFGQLAAWKAEGRSFDLIVLDPPAFAKSQAKVPAALAGYASLNRAALQILRPGGYLATASCSARVSAEAFAAAVAEAAGKLGQQLQLVEERHQPHDHPVLVEFPQGQYLKFFVYHLPEA
jgi:23S rRNA (cytosine1962-C5)-methyltransferase